MNCSDCDKELKDLIKEIKKEIKSLDSTKLLEKKQEKITHIQDRINRARVCIRSYKVAIRELKATESENWKQKCKAHTEDLNEMITTLQLKSEGLAQVGSISTEELLDKASKTQDKTVSSLNRILSSIEESKEIATGSAIKLHENNDKLQSIDQSIQQVESNLKKADSQLRSFNRRV